jgi:STE24 endopeptidase
MNESKASRYQRLRRRAHVADMASGCVLLALLALTPASQWLAGWAQTLGVGWPGPVHLGVAAASYVALIMILWELVSLPAVLYLALNVDRRFRNVDHTVEGLLAAQAQVMLVGLAAALVAAAIVMLAARATGDWWWLLAGVMLGLTLVGASRSAPKVLPLLGKARPIGRPSLMSALRELARRSDVPVSEIVEWRVHQGARTGALVAGIGRTRRVFVTSEMLRDWSDEEIAVVVAHELGHHVHRDLWRALALDAVVLSAALWTAERALGWLAPALALGGPSDLAALPFIGFVTGGVWLLATPLRHAQSRCHERRADRFALRLTGGAEAFGAAVRRLGARHLAEERPSTLTRWLFHRHPSVAERLALAEAFRRPTSCLRPPATPAVPCNGRRP